MAESIVDFLGLFFGALLNTFILTRLVNYIAKKMTTPINAALIAFFTASGTILLITSMTMGIHKGIIIYIPFLIFWLIVDLRRAKNKNQSIKGNVKNI